MASLPEPLYVALGMAVLCIPFAFVGIYELIGWLGFPFVAGVIVLAYVIGRVVDRLTGPYL